MVAALNELVLWISISVVVLVIHFNLKSRRYFSVFGLGMINHVTRESFKKLFEFPKIKFRFDGKTVSTSQSTAFEHDAIYHLASYLGQPLTVGSVSHAKTEIMNVESGQWKSAPDYPFHSK